jgi:hypothetical protein
MALPSQIRAKLKDRTKSHWDALITDKKHLNAKYDPVKYYEGETLFT